MWQNTSSNINSTLPPHAVIRPLKLSDVDAIQELESLGFPPEERMSREKTIYRLTVCPELSAGVFIRTFGKTKNTGKNAEEASVEGENNDQEDSSDFADDIEEVSDFDSDKQEDGSLSDGTEQDDTESGLKKKRPGNANNQAKPVKRKGKFAPRTGCLLPHGHSTFTEERLIAQVVATKMATSLVTEAAMEIPDLDKYNRPVDPNDPRGHHEDGKTLGIHSVIVHPDFQGQSVGSLLLIDYFQRMTTQHIAESAAILAHKHLTGFYGNLGFTVQGESECQFGNGGWLDLVRPFSESDEDDEYGE